MSGTAEVQEDSGVAVQVSQRHCVVVWVFALPEDRRQAFKALCEQFCERTDDEPKSVYHRFSYNGTQVQYRVAADDAFGVLAHVADMGQLLGGALGIVELERLEIHGPRDQIEQLREPLAAFHPDYYVAGFCTEEGCRAP